MAKIYHCLGEYSNTCDPLNSMDLRVKHVSICWYAQCGEKVISGYSYILAVLAGQMDLFKHLAQ